MDAKLKARWVAALRSGEYRQGKNGLRSLENEFCCLGVLIDIMDGRETWTYSEVVDGYMTESDEETALCGPRLRDVGLGTAEQQTLINMNDGSYCADGVGGDYTDNPQTFDQIADWIEENL